MLQKTGPNAMKIRLIFLSEQVVGRGKDLMACPESASPQLMFVLGGDHHNESHVYFRISNVLNVPNSKTVNTFFQKLSEIFEISRLLKLGI